MSPSRAAEASRVEVATWTRLAGTWDALPDHISPRPRELAVTGFDPGADLSRRGARWAASIDPSAPALAGFAEALALTEADGWDRDVPDQATRAYEDRRHLVGDRIVHWLVPWLDAVGRCYPELADDAHGSRDELLAIAEDMRIAPALAGSEGRFLPGEDALGPIEDAGSLAERLATLGCGIVITDATVRSLSGGSLTGRDDLPSVVDDPRLAHDLTTYFGIAEARWASTARRWPGSAELWTALAARCRRTAITLQTV